jgi:hypothetical protein
MAKPQPTPEGPTKGQLMLDTLTRARAERIRAARARTPQPTLEQIAFEVGCCVKTVWNVVNAKVHAPHP